MEMSGEGNHRLDVFYLEGNEEGGISLETSFFSIFEKGELSVLHFSKF